MTAQSAVISGAAGFVGARLAQRLLASGVRVELLVRPGSDLWRLETIAGEAAVREVDLRDAGAVQRVVATVRPDAVFHLAAHGAYSWQQNAAVILQTNVLGMLNLLEASSAADVQTLVHAGSSSEYGYKDHAPAEDELPEPNSHYGVAKVAATMLGQLHAARGDLHVTTLRLSSVYGPWEDPHRLVPTLIATGLDGGLPPLVAPDTGRDFIYVDDVCDAFIAVADNAHPNARIYNVGSGAQTTLREIVELARRELGLDQAPQWGAYEARPWDTTVWVSDPRRLTSETGWSPRHDLPRGFGLTVAWLRDHPELWARYETSGTRLARRAGQSGG